jgi:hypothetical protein
MKPNDTAAPKGAASAFTKGQRVRLVAHPAFKDKDREPATVRGMTPCGTGIALSEARAGYHNWNAGDLEPA